MSEESLIKQAEVTEEPQTEAAIAGESLEKLEEKDFVTAEDEAPPRPEWLPEKFKTPEALVESYTNLEKKQIVISSFKDLKLKSIFEFQDQFGESILSE